MCVYVCVNVDALTHLWHDGSAANPVEQCGEAVKLSFSCEGGQLTVIKNGAGGERTGSELRRGAATAT